mmetsp:Transcript_38954/g.103530  ORF Transcript_38954/g.103530 Transcript_38954/m.103530 type:complete len:275 (-) Transcript_38954:783-1607(-)
MECAVSPSEASDSREGRGRPTSPSLARRNARSWMQRFCTVSAGRRALRRCHMRRASTELYLRSFGEEARHETEYQGGRRNDPHHDGILQVRVDEPTSKRTPQIRHEGRERNRCHSVRSAEHLREKYVDDVVGNQDTSAGEVGPHVLTSDGVSRQHHRNDRREDAQLDGAATPSNERYLWPVQQRCYQRNGHDLRSGENGDLLVVETATVVGSEEHIVVVQQRRSVRHGRQHGGGRHHDRVRTILGLEESTVVDDGLLEHTPDGQAHGALQASLL